LIVGVTSYGKGSAQSLFPISDVSALKLTTALWYTPSGRSINKLRTSDDDGGDGDPLRTLGAETPRPEFKTDDGRFGDMLRVRCDPGRNEPGILVLSHADTVHPIGTLAGPLLGALVLEAMQQYFTQTFSGTGTYLIVYGVLFLAVMLVLLVRSRPPGVLLVYTLAVMGVALLTPTMGARPRFLLTAFPLVTVLAEDLPAPVFSGVLATSATLLGAFTVLTMTSLLATP